MDPISEFQERLQRSPELAVLISAGGHANCDSLPLRFGIHYDRTTRLLLKRCAFLKVDERSPDRVHVEARIRDGGDSEVPGHFVLKLEGTDQAPILITVWRYDIDTEFRLSEVMKDLRKSGLLKPSTLLKLHPRYVSGKLRAHADLVKYLAENLSEEGLKNLQAEADAAAERADIAIAALEQARQETIVAKEVALQATYFIDELEVKNKSLKSENQKLREELQEERRRFALERAAANREGAVAEISSPDTLMAVHERQMHRGSNCTILSMGDGSRRYLKTATFDRDGEVTRKAKLLIGRRVRTTCWDPINQPGKWSNQGYFRNIYAVE